ncbi:3-oxoacyl-ACP synthase III family protein [Mucilaginibacter sp. UR6-11]|uniref:3-oxoacyl-ACP synthase III family protein n=1 Tax=Mucilaginibacter sp. UR6-11 TaxID=1435644 RepID=UPI001E43CBC4|nr:ketoacyl-ACP synthase III [Mucilaginibacter sp. UR6-11]MCC8424865.1 ketoacyl-ACP synthase III [Mucilaginibacter sp. UR6-11]
MGSKITAIEYCFPEKELTNDDLSIEFPDYDFSKVEKKIGVKVRYIAGQNETALDLAIRASLKLLEKIDKSEIDFILYCTQSPEYKLPTTACILQDKLGLKTNIGALDFNLGCSGFTYGVSMAKALINSKQASNVLLITAETYSKYLNVLDRSNRSIFGDAATATLISYSDEEMIGNCLFGTDGSGYDKLIIKNGGSKNEFSFNPERISYGSGNCYTDNELYMNGPDVFNFTIDKIPPFSEELLKVNNCEKETIDQYIFHQANAFMLNSLRKKMCVDTDKFYIDLNEGGNTVSSTIPIALKKYSLLNLDDNEQNIMIVGFGVGLSWSGGVIKIKNKL